MAQQQRRGSRYYNNQRQETVSTQVQEELLQVKLEKLETRLQNVLDKYLKFEAAYGEEDYRTVMMRSILEVSVVMKDMIDTLMATKEAFQYLFEAMDIVDDTFNMFDQGLDNSRQVKYNFWTRLKQNRKIKRAIRNNINRMTQMSHMMVGLTDMATGMIKAIKGATKKIGKKMRKGQSGDGTSSSVTKMIEKAKQERGIPTTPTTPTSSTDPTTPSTSNPTSTDTGVDDL